MDAASSENVFPSDRDEWHVTGAGNRNENFLLFGDTGVTGDSGGWPSFPSNSFIDRAANSLTIAIAESNVFSSAARIGLT